MNSWIVVMATVWFGNPGIDNVSIQLNVPYWAESQEFSNQQDCEKWLGEMFVTNEAFSYVNPQSSLHRNYSTNRGAFTSIKIWDVNLGNEFAERQPLSEAQCVSPQAPGAMWQPKTN